MSPELSERSFEEAIECGLLEYGPDACAGAANVVRETSPLAATRRLTLTLSLTCGRRPTGA